MVSALAALVLFAAPAHAELPDPAVTVGPELSVLGGSQLTARPGLRLGFEPERRYGVDAFYSVMFANIWHAGLAPELRHFFGKDERTGVYLGARLPIGLIGDMKSQLEGTAGEVTTDASNSSATADLSADAPAPADPRLKPAVALQAGVGWRFGRIAGLELMAGPEWDGIFGMNWRASLAFDIIMRNDPDDEAPGRRAPPAQR